jgi:MFS family permease
MAALQPWQKTFIALAAPGVLVVTLLAFLKDSPAKVGPAAEGPRREDYADLLKRLPQYILISLGMALTGVASYACVSWMPTVISREFGWSPSQIGAEYGLLLMFASPPGLLLGGWLSDTLVARGHNNAHALVALLSASLTLLLSLSVPLLTSPAILLAFVGTMHFSICLAAGSSPAYLQLVTPRRLRGQVSAAYILVLNALGLGIAPALIGWLSSLSADDPHGLRFAVAEVVIPSLCLAAVLLGILAWRERRTGPQVLGRGVDLAA